MIVFLQILLLEDWISNHYFNKNPDSPHKGYTKGDYILFQRPNTTKPCEPGFTFKKNLIALNKDLIWNKHNEG